MKAQIESTSANICGGVRRAENGRVHKAKKSQSRVCARDFLESGIMASETVSKKEEDSAEIKAYLNKLQELVPFMPKNKKLSKLEVISNVIEYIHDLRETLGFPPCDNDEDDMNYEGVADVAMISTPVLPNLSTDQEDLESVNECNQSPQLHYPQNRQPLCVISSPNNVISSKIEDSQVNYEHKPVVKK